MTDPGDTLWAVDHPGIGLLAYDDEPAARVAAGTAGTLKHRTAVDQPWRTVTAAPLESTGTATPGGAVSGR